MVVVVVFLAATQESCEVEVGEVKGGVGGMTRRRFYYFTRLTAMVGPMYFLLIECLVRDTASLWGRKSPQSSELYTKFPPRSKLFDVTAGT